MGFAQSTIGSLTVGWEDPPAAEVEYVRTRDWWTVAEALRAPAAVIHVTVGAASPFTAELLTPSAAARRAFG